METKINIADILKDKPKGTKLYSILSDGECFLNDVSEDEIYIDIDNRERFWCFSANGSTYSFPNGCVLLFPSKEMRDWSKFVWKKGDVLVHKDGDVHIIFEGFVDDTYCSFVGKYYLWKENNNTEQFYEKERLLTSDFQKADKDAAQTYINTIEKRLCGKFNRETLGVEKIQPEFKDGDIIKITWDKYSAIVIFLEYSNFGKGFDSHVFFNIKTKIIEYNIHGHILQDTILRLATEEEKKQLFSALEKEGKAWDVDKKQIVDLKPKVEFKPFDKVLVRNSDADKWLAGFFEKFEKSWNNPYHIMNLHHMTDFAFKQCIPYEGNESLLGTTKDMGE